MTTSGALVFLSTAAKKCGSLESRAGYKKASAVDETGLNSSTAIRNAAYRDRYPPSARIDLSGETSTIACVGDEHDLPATSLKQFYVMIEFVIKDLF